MPEPRTARKERTITALLGLGTALFFGGADFLGGLAAARVSAIRATALSAAAGLIVLLVALPLVPGSWSAGALSWGALAGVVGACTVALIYASLAVGPMSILAPLGAVIGAIVPALYGFGQGERLGAAGAAGVVAALAAVVLVGLVPHADAVRPGALGLLLATGAGLSMGAGIIVLDNTPADSGILPLVVGRSVSATIMGASVLGVALLARRRGRANGRGWRPALPFSLAGGGLAALADLCMLTGVRVGDVAVVGLLAALASAVTVALAAVVLRERLAPPQTVGLVFALAAALLLAAD